VVVPLTDRASAGKDVVILYLFNAYLGKESKTKTHIIEWRWILYNYDHLVVVSALLSPQ
jgi:hypothetical protein